MKALLIKDIKTILPFFIFIAVFGLLTIMVDTIPYLSFVYVFLIPITLMNQDELTHFNRLASMLPISTAEAVAEKYVITLIGLGIAVAFSILGDVVGWFALETAFDIDIILIASCLVLVYCAVTLPLDFLVTTQIGRTVMLVVSALIIGILGGLAGAGFVGDMSEAFAGGGLPAGIRIGLVAVSALLFAVSIPVSIAIYKRKDR